MARRSQKRNALGIRKKDVELIARTALPHIFLQLARARILKEEHLREPTQLVRILMNHRREAIRKIEWCAALDHTFLEEACKYWRKRDKTVAIVLYATAIEQCINSYFQLILEAKGWSRPSATELIRSSKNASKLRWLFESFVGNNFPVRLRERIEKIFTIRNAIVHFKAIPGRLDEHTDSHSRITREIATLRRMSLSRDFSLLENAMFEGMLKVDPDRELAWKAAEQLAKARPIKRRRG